MHPRTPNCVLFSTYTKLQSIYLFKGYLNCKNLKKWFFGCVMHLLWKLRLLCQIFTMYSSTTLNLKTKLITVIFLILVWKSALYQIYKNYPCRPSSRQSLTDRWTRTSVTGPGGGWTLSAKLSPGPFHHSQVTVRRRVAWLRLLFVCESPKLIPYLRCRPAKYIDINVNIKKYISVNKTSAVTHVLKSSRYKLFNTHN